jgi:hypothetical protein
MDRKLAETKKQPSRETVAKSLGASVAALDKSNLRLLKQARLMFPLAVLGGVAELAVFLNNLLGPLRSTEKMD